MFHGIYRVQSKIEQLADSVMNETDQRIHEKVDVPRQRRGKNLRKRPDTSIISRAAQEAYDARVSRSSK